MIYAIIGIAVLYLLSKSKNGVSPAQTQALQQANKLGVQSGNFQNTAQTLLKKLPSGAQLVYNKRTGHFSPLNKQGKLIRYINK